MIQELLPQAERIAAVLKSRGETISVAKSSTAGLISAALLAVAGASAYFMGGAVVYTRASRTELLRVTEEEFAALTGITPSTEPYAMLFARKIRERLATTWAIGETGTAGPTGSRYGHAPGHSCIAVLGPVERAITIETGQSRPGRQHARVYGGRARSAREKSRRGLIPKRLIPERATYSCRHGVAVDRAPEPRIPQAHIPPASPSRPGGNDAFSC